MKNTKRIILVVLATIVSMGAIVVGGLVVYYSQPRQYLTESYGVQIPSGIELLGDQSDWDTHLSYGILKVRKDYPDGLVDIRNFSPLSESKDSRIKTLIHDINEAFSISKVTISSKHISYQKFTVKGNSMLVIFYNKKTQEYCFYAMEE